MAEQRPCQFCGGDGWVYGERSVMACCGNVNSVGECRSHCVVQEFEQTQEPCDYCGGSGAHDG